jgi:hypothetical protein
MENAMTAKLTSKLILAAALSVAAVPVLASDATDLVVSSANGAAVYPVYAAKEAPPALEKKDAPKQERAQHQDEGRGCKCECHS